RREGAAPLPRRVPQTSLAAELREEAPAGEHNGHTDEFTAEQAAASLAGFQRGTLRARDDDTETQYDQEDAPGARDPDALPAAGTPVPSTPPADR
ncbi:MAG: histidine kinase, partial [Nonomuraea sp.]|nr:histidine kinase [Nonomuraea sp.]